uniref:Reverse transcriptase domain-containing protein n=1 Tax=Trichuris muris TaxID=70415 RepID=A0A5S6QFZ4_TRIMR
MRSCDKVFLLVGARLFADGWNFGSCRPVANTYAKTVHGRKSGFAISSEVTVDSLAFADDVLLLSDRPGTSRSMTKTSAQLNFTERRKE